MAEYKYWAFISYSHQDEEWAGWLHSAIETYRVPRNVMARPGREGPLPRRLFPVFRDRDELAGASDLSTKIQEALAQSRYLVVICSPKAAVSKWVNEEIKTFKAMGRADRVLCLIVDGEPNATDKPDSGQLECFPEAVRYIVDLKREITKARAEPIAADARKGKDGKEAAKLKLLAGILDVGYDELRQREAARQRWRRIRIAAAGCALGLAAAFAYVLAADAGARVPGHEDIRDFVDRHEASIFRHVHTHAEIREAAAALRLDLVHKLENDARKTVDAVARRKPGPWTIQTVDEELSTWGSSQALYILAHTPEASPELLRQAALPILDAIFKPGTAIPRYGWIEYRAGHTRVEPALWTAALLPALLARRDALRDEERGRVLKHLQFTHEVLRTYRMHGRSQPGEPGGWYQLPHQKNAGEYFTYAGALALIALLETREVGLPWEGSTERRDELLASTVRWLVSQFKRDGAPPGWLPAPDDRGAISDGLTLQVYATMLQVEEEVGLPLAPEIEAAIRAQVASLGTRRVDHPTTNNRFIRTFRNHEGREMSMTPTTEYLWYPWAVDCTARWLRRLEKKGEPVLEQVRARRVLGHLVMKLNEGQGMVRKVIASPDSWMAAEVLYGLSSIPAPGK